MIENQFLGDEILAQTPSLAAECLPGRFLASLGDEALLDFFSVERRKTLPAGSSLYREGDLPFEVYVLLDGYARVSLGSHSGRRLILKLAKPGEVLGLASAVTGRTHFTTAELMYPAEISLVRVPDFLAFLKRCPEASWAVMREIGMENQMVYSRLRTMGTSSSVVGRLSRLILEWGSTEEWTRKARRHHMPMTHYEIADCIGISRESVTRAMSELQNEGVIEVRGTALTILNRNELQARSLK